MKALFLDTETSGLDPKKNLLLEIALVYLDLHDFSRIFSYSSVVFYQEKTFTKKSDINSLKINGFSYQDVKNGICVSRVKHEILYLINSFELNKQNSVVVCQNPSFDRSFFSQLLSVEDQKKINFPYHWLDLASMFWCKYVFPKISVDPNYSCSLSKDSIARNFGVFPEESPHRAMNGVNHLIECFQHVVKSI